MREPTPDGQQVRTHADGCGLAFEGARQAKKPLACVPVIQPLSGQHPSRSTP